MLVGSNKIQPQQTLADTYVRDFRRNGVVIGVGITEVLSGTRAEAKPAYLILKDIIENKSPRANTVSDLATVMAVCRLADGEKLELSVVSEGSHEQTTQKETVEYFGFRKLVEDRNVISVLQQPSKGVELSFANVKIQEILKKSGEDGACAILVDTYINGSMRCAFKICHPSRDIHNASTFEIKEIRKAIGFCNVIDEGKYERVSKSSPDLEKFISSVSAQL